MVGTGSEVKERGSAVRARVSDSEYQILMQIGALGGENPTNINMSEAIRFCIDFTGKILALLPEAVVEAVMDVKEHELGNLKKNKKEKKTKNGRNL